jgi:hypothetical protein
MNRPIDPDHPSVPATVTDCDGFRVPIRSTRDIDIERQSNGRYSLVVEYCGENRTLAHLDRLTDAKQAKRALDLLRSALFPQAVEE